MAIEVETTGTGAFRGHKTSIGSYEYTEGAMPHDVYDDSGEVGQLSFQVNDTAKNQAILLYRDGVQLTDDFYGSITGSVNSYNFSDGVVDLTGVSRLNLINTEGFVPASVTTVKQYVRSILAAANITSDIVLSPAVPTDAITTPGFEGNLWVLLKQFAAFHQLDVSLVRNTVYVRPMREREISVLNVTQNLLSLAEDTFAQKFQVAYYNYERLVDTLAFPFGGWNREVEVYQVEANETVVFDIEVDGFLESVRQPVVEDEVPKDYDGIESVFSASGNDGLPISAAFWENEGGRMSFELLENGTIIRVTIVGPDYEELSPYSIAVSDGSTEYSTLRIVGTGVFKNRQLVTVPTGLTENETPQEFGQEIDNVFIATREEAYDAGVRARRRYCLPRQTYETGGRRLEKPDFTEYDYLVLDDPVFGVLDSNVLAFVDPEDAIVFFDSFQTYAASLPDVYSFTDFADDYASASFRDFQDSVAEIVTQAFGTIAGSRVRFQDAFYRVRTTSVSPSETFVTSEFDTFFSDVNAEFSQFSFGQFTGVNVGLSFDDYALIPLRTEQYVDVEYFVLDESKLDEGVLAYG